MEVPPRRLEPARRVQRSSLTAATIGITGGVQVLLIEDDILSGMGGIEPAVAIVVDGDRARRPVGAGDGGDRERRATVAGAGQDRADRPPLPLVPLNPSATPLTGRIWSARLKQR